MFAAIVAMACYNAGLTAGQAEKVWAKLRNEHIDTSVAYFYYRFEQAVEEVKHEVEQWH